MTQCPVCQATVASEAKEGGTLLRNRYLRLTPDGKIVLGCPQCGNELLPSRGRLVLFRRRRPSVPSSSPPSAGGRPPG